MALTARQRDALPDSAFAYPGRRAYPVPTANQARRSDQAASSTPPGSWQ
jgi:hypothetical protein